MAAHCSGCVFTVCVCVFTAVCVHFGLQITNSEYGSPYLAVCHVTFTNMHTAETEKEQYAEANIYPNTQILV